MSKYWVLKDYGWKAVSEDEFKNHKGIKTICNYPACQINSKLLNELVGIE